MTAVPDRFGQPGTGPGVAFALHPAALRPGAQARGPAYAARPPPPATTAPPWVSPYGPQAWALPRAEDWQLPAPPLTHPFPVRAPSPAAAPLEHPAIVARRPWKRQAAAGLCLLAAGFAAAALLSRPRAQSPVAAAFTVPRPIPRATAADSHVSPAAAPPGTAVPPQAVLITIRLATDPAPTPAPPARIGPIDTAMVLPLPDTGPPPPQPPPRQRAAAAFHRAAAHLHRRARHPLRQNSPAAAGALRARPPARISLPPAACPVGQTATITPLPGTPVASAR